MSVPWLVDTNVVSELVRPVVNPGVDAWARAQAKLHLSVITVEEVEFGLAWRPKPRVQAWWVEFLAAHCVVHPVSTRAARAAGHLRGQLQAAGLVRTQADLLIAATAGELGATLVTRNVGDFAGCGVAVWNPFS